MNTMSPVPKNISDFFPPTDVLMIRPSCFGWNEQTAETNSFVKINVETPHKKALIEFDDVVETIRSYGINVAVVDDLPSPHTPDSMFPTWFSAHHQHKGVVLLYPMMAENRRLERRRDVLEKLSIEEGFKVSKIADLAPLENEGEYLEGCGSLVLDRINRVAYAVLSPRTTLEAVGRFSQHLDYKIVILQAHDENGLPLHHTNTVMSIAKDFAIVCFEAFSTMQSKNMVLKRLAETGRDVITISMEQMKSFAGNIIQLRNQQGEKVTFMSERAYSSLDMEQIKMLAKHGKVVSIAIPTIEDVGGASIGSMIAPICLPKKASRTARRTSKLSPRAKKQTPSIS